MTSLGGNRYSWQHTWYDRENGKHVNDYVVVDNTAGMAVEIFRGPKCLYSAQDITEWGAQQSDEEEETGKEEPARAPGTWREKRHQRQMRLAHKRIRQVEASLARLEHTHGEAVRETDEWNTRLHELEQLELLFGHPN